MSELLVVKLVMYGQALSAPVNVEIFDLRLNYVASQWLTGYQEGSFSLEPGTYALRAALPSGRAFEKVINIEPGVPVSVSIPVHEASPHEGHEWAYVSRDIAALGDGLLSEDTFGGMWARLWSRTPGAPWMVEPLENPGDLSDDEDGVSFSLNTRAGAQMMLQVGGDNVPWKLAVLPPDKTTMILIRPATGPAGRVHPVELVVSSQDWQLESLLSLLGRGKTDKAEDLLDKNGLAQEAEQRLFSKVTDPYGAMIGGYALLHLQALERMHHWAANLANWFDWIPDGAVIHGWQQFELAREAPDDASREQLIGEARTSFLEAQQRGVPIIAEGVRRLRDGLLMFHSNDKSDQEVKDALARVGGYTAAVDFTASTTVFTGAHPDEPLTEPPLGMPDDDELISYVYDVPLADAIDSGALEPGADVSVNDLDGNTRAGTINADGTLAFDGNDYDSVGAAQKAITGRSRGALYDWKLTEGSMPMADIARALRFQPRSATKR